MTSDETAFNEVFELNPTNVRLDRATFSPVGPFKAIFADSVIVYWRPEKLEWRERMDYRKGSPDDLIELAARSALIKKMGGAEEQQAYKNKMIWLLVGKQVVCKQYAYRMGLSKESWKHITSDQQLRGLEGRLRNSESIYRLKLLDGPGYSIASDRNFIEVARSRGFDV